MKIQHKYVNTVLWDLLLQYIGVDFILTTDGYLKMIKILPYLVHGWNAPGGYLKMIKILPYLV